jgi:hypothetical protein
MNLHARLAVSGLLVGVYLVLAIVSLLMVIEARKTGRISFYGTVYERTSKPEAFRFHLALDRIIVVLWLALAGKEAVECWQLWFHPFLK